MDWILWCQITIWVCILAMLIMQVTGHIIKIRATCDVTKEQMKKGIMPGAYPNQ